MVFGYISFCGVEVEDQDQPDLDIQMAVPTIKKAATSNKIAVRKAKTLAAKKKASANTLPAAKKAKTSAHRTLGKKASAKKTRGMATPIKNTSVKTIAVGRKLQPKVEVVCQGGFMHIYSKTSEKSYAAVNHMYADCMYVGDTKKKPKPANKAATKAKKSQNRGLHL